MKPINLLLLLLSQCVFSMHQVQDTPANDDRVSSVTTRYYDLNVFFTNNDLGSLDRFTFQQIEKWSSQSLQSCFPTFTDKLGKLFDAFKKELKELKEPTALTSTPTENLEMEALSISSSCTTPADEHTYMSLQPISDYQAQRDTASNYMSLICTTPQNTDTLPFMNSQAPTDRYASPYGQTRNARELIDKIKNKTGYKISPLQIEHLLARFLYSLHNPSCIHFNEELLKESRNYSIDFRFLQTLLTKPNADEQSSYDKAVDTEKLGLHKSIIKSFIKDNTTTIENTHDDTKLQSVMLVMSENVNQVNQAVTEYLQPDQSNTTLNPVFGDR